MILNTAKSIAEKIEGKLFADESIIITGVGNPEEAFNGDVVCIFCENESKTKLPPASLFVVSEKSDFKNVPIIKVNNPRKAFITLLELFNPHKKNFNIDFISPFAIVSPTAKIASGITIHQGVSIGENTIIDENCVFYPGTYIGNNVKIGKHVILKPGVVIEDYVTIGNNVTIHSGTIIGTDGFGYFQIDGEHKKIPQIGSVIIEDDVEIGANVCIDRATVKNTIIKKGTKIDNLVQIAHNCEIGENCIIVSQVGISGSCKLGKGCILAGQVGIADHISLADGVIALSKSGIAKSVTYPNSSVWGTPAREAGEMRRIVACENRLSDLFKRVKNLENNY